jgi:hypothetical protein
MESDCVTVRGLVTYGWRSPTLFAWKSLLELDPLQSSFGVYAHRSDAPVSALPCP